MKLSETLKAARRVSTPLLSISTADQYATVQEIVETMNGGAPVLCHDVVRGLTPRNASALERYPNLEANRLEMASPVEAITWAVKNAEQGTVIVMLNAHRWITQDLSASQAIGLCRDAFKQNRRTLVLMGPEIRLPLELQQDVVTLDSELPNDEALDQIARAIHEAASVEPPTDLSHEIAAVRGLSAFAAEQVFAMSMTKSGLDLTSCWERKRAAINQTNGLSIGRSIVSFDQVGGLDGIKGYFEKLFKGPVAPQVIVRVDEIEKMLAGAGLTGGHGDSTGVTQYQVGKLLTSMEEWGWSGMIALGPAGSGKSLVANAIGGTFGVPTIDLDLGAMKDSLVGNSEANTNAAVRVIEAVAGDRAFFVATCNRLDALPAELRRRFRAGVWFFDLPGSDERKTIWQIQGQHYGVDVSRGLVMNDEGWTGAEIRNCCEQAFSLGVNVAEASRWIVPLSRTQPEVVESLRAIAKGRFFSASSGRVYSGEEKGGEKESSGRRTIVLPDRRN